MTISRPQHVNQPTRWIYKLHEHPGIVLGVILLAGMTFFEMFNYSTTEFALRDLLGDLKFAGIAWSTTLAIAFCSIDFAGLARLFAPEDDDWRKNRPVWYLFGAWLLAATMNAVLTWWGVSMALVNHAVESTSIIDASTILMIVPVFVTMMVFVIRILLIGSITAAGSRFLWGTKKTYNRPSPMRNVPMNNQPTPSHQSSALPRTTTMHSAARMKSSSPRTEPTYHNFQ